MTVISWCGWTFFLVAIRILSKPKVFWHLWRQLEITEDCGICAKLVGDARQPHFGVDSRWLCFLFPSFYSSIKTLHFVSLSILFSSFLKRITTLWLQILMEHAWATSFAIKNWTHINFCEAVLSQGKANCIKMTWPTQANRKMFADMFLHK